HRFSLGLCWVASQEVDRCQLLSHLDVRGVEPLRLLQVVERRSRLSELVMSQPQLAGDPHVGGLNAEDVAVFDDGFSVLSPRKVLVTAVEMTGLLSLRRPRAPGHRDQDGQDTDDPAAGYSSNHVFASYSGWPWKKTNKLFVCFTNASTPACSDRVSTR